MVSEGEISWWCLADVFSEKFRLVMFIYLGYPDCWRRDYKINSEITGTIREKPVMTTVGYFPRAAWEMQMKTLHCTAKSRRTLL